jgi:chromate reductase, NAD(P)H dehydrogenase (quinone)
MQTIIGIAGSLRRGSYNLALLEAARTHAPEDCRIEIASIRGIPLYDGDLEASEGVPQSVEELKTRLVQADALLLATPEYNNSIPGVLKNAMDWLSRPPADIARVFERKPVGIIGASQGGFGTLLSQSAWLPVFKTLRAQTYSGRSVRVSRARQAFDESGVLIDAEQVEQVRAFMQGFSAFITASTGAR